MKNSILILLTSFMAVFFACGGQNSSSNLSAEQFLEKMKSEPNAVLIDVRTEEEFASGSISGAQNIVLDGSFNDKVTLIDKSKAVFLYCLSGRRSGAAMARMQQMGFTQVYNLSGGIREWRSKGMPEASENSPSVGMSSEEFSSLLGSKEMVLIDFYAEWCPPCKKMAPFMEELKTEMKNKVLIVKIDADKNQTLAGELGINSLPTLMLYKGQKMVWKHLGYIEKAALVAVLNSK